MKLKIYMMMAILIFVFAGCSQATEEQNIQEKSNQEEVGETDSTGDLTAAFEGNIEHVHGIGYVNDETIAFAAHSGIKLYKRGEWLEATAHQNDYMGFNVVDDGFYTSGHPGPESDLPNPIGLQKGKILKKELSLLGFEGESDFHIMGVGYRNHAIYIFNEHPNSVMEQGLYSSFNDGETWETLKAENLGEKIFQLAVHPDNENMVAAASASGIYLSQNAGESFTRISEQGQGSALYFTEDKLYYGLYTGTPSLNEYNIQDQSKKEVNLPELNEDAVLYLAQNTDNQKEMTIYTVKGSSFITSNSGDSWTQIIESGTTK